MEVKLYNSYTNQVEVFKPIRENKVSMYVCGPTVYGYAHIGNLRPVVTFDILRRLFIRLGYEVTYVSNITDIDDKIINVAIKENKTEKEIAQFFEDNYYDVCRKINAMMPDHNPHATTTIPLMIEFIQKLIEKGYAYVSDGDVFFRVLKAKDYGKLGNFNVEDLKAGARIEENSKKENALDFALWKKTEVGIKFPAVFGEGRPGWHTECVVMINSLFDDARIDIHGGGFDLKFPHHENEIAQAKAMYGHSIATYWMHNGFINIDNVKMSKSLGNVKLAKDLVEEYNGNTIRMVMLSSHYRAPLNFSDEVLTNASNDLNKIYSALKQASILCQVNGVDSFEYNNQLMNDFLEALADDLNTANALTYVYNCLKQLNILVRQKDYVNAKVYYEEIKEMLEILGIIFDFKTLTDEEKSLYNEWNNYRVNKDFENADKLRGKLVELGLM